mgnify:CR=1 FL=1
MHTYVAKPITEKKQWNDFYNLPKNIYKHDNKQALELKAQISEELNADKNPIAKTCKFQAFIVYKGERVVARAVAIINKDLDSKMNKKIGQIGYLEFINDKDSLLNIIEICSTWFKQHQCDTIWTDTRFSLNYQVGIQIDGFDQRHSFLMPRQPEYYTELLTNLGFYSVKSMSAYNIDLKNNYQPPKEISDQAQALKNEGYVVRNMNRSDLWSCLLDYNTRWGDNFAHTPFSLKELAHLKSSMNIFLDTRFCFLVEKEGKLAGYLFTFPDYYHDIKDWRGKLNPINIASFIWKYKIKKNVTGLKTAIIGVTEPFIGKRLSSLLNDALLKQAINNKCQYIERSWILEDNIASIKQAQKMGAVKYKEFAIFEIKLSNIQSYKYKQAI